jgi:acetolactate decarboxylase
MKWHVAVTVVVVAILIGAVGVYAFTSNNANKLLEQGTTSNLLFQESTIGALQAGDYDGDMSLKELKAHGNFGLGTFNDLDGEMVFLEGTFYQIKSDGNVHPVNNSMMTPFADVTSFQADTKFSLDDNEHGTMNYTQVQHQLEGRFPTKNTFYAVKITGEYTYLKARSPPKQNKPYPLLVDALKNQSVFEFQNVTGTMVGFWSPQYVNGLNTPGWHFHFISTDRKHGGHVLDVTVQRAIVEIQETSGFSVVLPHNDAFYALNALSGSEMPSGIKVKDV